MQSNTSGWLKAMQVGMKYVRYYESRRALHAVETAIYKFNHGAGLEQDIVLRQDTQSWKFGDRVVHMMVVRCEAV